MKQKMTPVDEKTNYEKPHTVFQETKVVMNAIITVFDEVSGKCQDTLYNHIIFKIKEKKMNFSEALDLIKQGKKIGREGWNGKNMFLFLVPGSKFIVNRLPLLGIYPEGTEIEYHAHIDMKTAQGYVVPWLASQADLLSDDWMVIE